MKTNSAVLIVVLFLACFRCGLSQGFVNLNFESATLSGYDAGTGNIPTSSAMPGWSAYFFYPGGTNATSLIAYNDVSLGSAFIALIDTNSIFTPLPLQGRYSVLLMGSTATAPTVAAIGQTGLVPANALSLLFYTSFDSNIQLAFNGQPIPLVQTGSTATYAIRAGNISTFAGQTGQLLFSAYPNSGSIYGYGSGLIDNIQFSSAPIPEPSALALSALGGLALVLVKNRQRKPVSA